MKRQYKRAQVHAAAEPEAGRITIETQGVTRLSIKPGPKLVAREGKTAVLADGDSLSVAGLGSKRVSFEIKDGSWRISDHDDALRKRHDLGGPVSDAFAKPFLSVRPTGSAWNAGIEAWASGRLELLEKYWLSTQRAVLPVKDDRDVTAEDIKRYNLILFGDPGSNRILARLLPQMKASGLEWSKSAVALGGRSFPADSHVPVVIYPNPESPDRYVVINARAEIPQEWEDFGNADFSSDRRLRHRRHFGERRQ